MKKYQHIMIACDLVNQGDNSVIEAVLPLPKDHECKVSLLHVLELAYSVAPPSGDFLLAQCMEEMKVEAIKQLAVIGEKSGVPKENQHVVFGLPKNMIIAEAEKFNVDLLVLGHHRRQALQQFFLGSTAEAVLHKAKCDTFIVQISNNND
ncbi:MAG: universal stress protein [Myxococcales bacterium]|nr:universal stress protein [Myxococcales bacterium]USN51511.1 MAG: universal stress protein [Myxococcales bacterium]